MKEEKECVLLMKLIDSPFKSGGLWRKSQPVCKKEIERYLGFSENNKEFNSWINELIKEGCLVSDGMKPKGLGKMVEVYVADKKKTYKRLRRIEKYNRVVFPFFEKRSLAGAIDESML